MLNYQFVSFSSGRRFPGNVTWLLLFSSYSHHLYGSQVPLRMYYLVFMMAVGMIWVNVVECVECSEWNRLFLRFETSDMRVTEKVRWLLHGLPIGQRVTGVHSFLFFILIVKGYGTASYEKNVRVRRLMEEVETWYQLFSRHCVR